MDFSQLSNDELADVTRDLFDELHKRVDAMPDGFVKVRFGKHLAKAHKAMNGLQGAAKTTSTIQPMSGGDNKTPPK
jgi:hypothetical protein